MSSLETMLIKVTEQKITFFFSTRLIRLEHPLLRVKGEKTHLSPVLNTPLRGMPETCMIFFFDV